MEKQEKGQLKELLKKYLDSTSMDSNQSSSANDIINMLDSSSENGPTKDGKNSSNKSATELSKSLEEANEFLKYVTNMYANALGIDESELEDPNNEDSNNENSSEDSVSVFDLDIKEAEKISDNLYDWGLEGADVDIDKDGNVLVFGLSPADIPHFTEAFNDAFSKDMTQQDITDYLKDAYNRYKSNKPLKDSYEEGYPIEDDLRNGRVFLKDMVVKFPHLDSEEEYELFKDSDNSMDSSEEEYDLFQDADDYKFITPRYYHYYIDGVTYIISKFPEEEFFVIVDKRFPLYDFDKQLPFAISLDKLMVIGEEDNYELNKLKYNDGEYQYYSFENGDKLFIIYKGYDSNEFYLCNTINL